MGLSDSSLTANKFVRYSIYKFLTTGTINFVNKTTIAFSQVWGGYQKFISFVTELY